MSACLPPRTAAVSVPDLVAGHCQPTPLPETPKYSQESLAQSLVGSLLLSPGSWCVQGFACIIQESLFSQSKEVLIPNTTDLQSQILWGFSVPLLDPQVGKSVVGAGIFASL